MNLIDTLVFSLYCIGILFVAYYVSRKKKGEQQTTRDYFLAGNKLPWWAIGTSLIAANISAEQLIGMTGDGYRLGLAIASYEWMAAATLLIVARYFLPIFLDLKIYSMPQFLEIRYNEAVRTSLAILWLILYVFVNLTSILYLGGVCIEAVFKVDLTTAIVCIAAISAVYTIVGGLKAIAFTDPIQVAFLVVGGLITTYLALSFFSGGSDVAGGMGQLYSDLPGKFKMILGKDHPHYASLPGLTVLVGGMWIVNLNYWGFNQYITQRALAAKSLGQAQNGLVFASFLKLLMPLIVVIPGIIAYGIDPQQFEGRIDQVYPWLLNTFLTDGVKGIAFAALVAAVVGSLGSKTNSIATIFTMDIFRNYIDKKADDKKLVFVGRATMAISLLIAIFIAPRIRDFGGGFEFIQRFTGMFSPGIFVIFIYGLFWKKATAKGAMAVAIATLPLSLLFFLTEDIHQIPFLDQMGIIFLLLTAVMVVFSLADLKAKAVNADPKAIVLRKGLFKTGVVFNVGAVCIIAILIALYTVFY